MALHLRKTVLGYLKEHPDERFAAREIAEWIFATYPEECQDKKDKSQALKTDIDLIQQIVSEIGAHIPPCQKNEPQLKITDDKPRKFYYSTLSSDANEVLMTGNPREQTIVISDKKNNNEHAMYPLISQYLSKELGVFSKRINEKRSSNSMHEKKSNHWLHPDIVGIEDLGVEWHQEVRDCVHKYSDKRSKLWSFEAKLEINRSNVRECFFSGSFKFIVG